jgi:preprotein translocase subunit SecE
MTDKLKIAAAILLLVAGIAVYYLLGGSSILLRTGIVLLAAAGAVAVALTSEPGQRALAFAQSARQEVRKVVWPARRETMQGTMVVLAMVIILGLYLWILDSVVFWTVYDLILGVRL